MSGCPGGRRRLCVPHARVVITLGALLALGCDAATDDDGGVSDDGAVGVDAGTPIDGGAPSDAGTPLDAHRADATAPVDASSDDAAAPVDATPPRDGSTPTDAAAPMDASTMDATTGDAGAVGGDADVAPDASLSPDAGLAPDGGAPPIVDDRDVYAPRAYVEQGATQPDPTSAAPIVFDVTFDEPIWAASLQASDFVIEPAVPLTAVVVDAGDSQRFELRLSDLPRADQQYRVSLPHGRVVDLNGNPNEPSVSSDNRVSYDDPASTVDVRPYLPFTTPVMNTLPITFQIVFQAFSVAGFDVTDVVNGGTAPGVVWELQPLTAGYAYLVRATAVGGQGTVFPVVPAGATVATTTGQPNLESSYFGDPIVYTPLPILQVFDDEELEGSTLGIQVAYQGALRPATSPLIDWATSDGTAIAGVDYTASGGVDVAVNNGVSLLVPTLEDLLPEPHKDLSVRITNVRGDVYVASDTATGTIANDDRGYFSIGRNDDFHAGSGPTDIGLSADSIYAFGVSHGGGLRLAQYDRVTATTTRSLSISGRTSGGMALDATGYFYATNTYDDSFTLVRFDYASDWYDPDFPEVEVTDPTDTLEAVDLAADDAQVYVLGRRTSPAGDTAWFIEARDGASGALVPGFGAGGVLALDRVAGATVEAPTAIRTDGASIFVLGAIDGVTRVERRSASTGALVTSFATGGVLAFPSSTRAVDISLGDGGLFVVAAVAGVSLVERYRATDGGREWSFASPMDDPRCITASDVGVFFGGAREAATHLERWTLDGDPIWSRTHAEDMGPEAFTAIAYEPGSHWVHSVGFYTYGGFGGGGRDWFYDRRYIEDGLRHTYEPGATPE